MNSILKFNEFVTHINESYRPLYEAFKSSKIREFKEILDKHPKMSTILPKGIKWDLIEDDDVITNEDQEFTRGYISGANKLNKEDPFYVIWFNQDVKYDRDSDDITPGLIFITMGNRHINDNWNYKEDGIGNIDDITPATSKYTKSHANLPSVSKLFTEFNYTAIAIRESVLKSYSSEKLRELRRSQKKDAYALLNMSTILYKNTSKYKEWAPKLRKHKQWTEYIERIDESYERLNEISMRLFNKKSNELYLPLPKIEKHDIKRFIMKSTTNSTFSSTKEDYNLKTLSEFGKLLEIYNDVLKTLDWRTISVGWSEDGTEPLSQYEMGDMENELKRLERAINEFDNDNK